MKKAVAAAAAVLMIAANIPAYADVIYDGDRHAVFGNGEAEGYRTVFVQKANEVYSPENILYIGEDSGGFDAAVKFMLKNPAEAGDYVVRLGGREDEGIKEVNFTISSEDEQGEKPMAKILSEDEGDNVRVGFTAEYVYLPAYNSVLITYTDENNEQVTLGYPMSELISGNVDAEANFGLQINGVPSQYAESISVSLSKQEVSVK